MYISIYIYSEPPVFNSYIYKEINIYAPEHFTVSKYLLFIHLPRFRTLTLYKLSKFGSLHLFQIHQLLCSGTWALTGHATVT